MAFYDQLFTRITAEPERHVRTGDTWKGWQDELRPQIEKDFSAAEPGPVPFGPFGEIRFPYHKMGSITSLELFGLDELILFAFYNANRARYRRVVDFGANIGLHSLMLSRSGFEVRSFEPDPVHADLFRRNMALNGAMPDLHQAAVSLEDGTTEFVRVLGNTTGSHIAGAKSNPYGELERFAVTIEAAAPHLAWADLAKIDIEGHEAQLLTGLPAAIWEKTDAVMEVGTAENAAKIFDFLGGHASVNMFSQKNGWNKVTRLEHMPVGHWEGSLFLSAKDRMPWK
jgi:FkbM family methyltransferase